MALNFDETKYCITKLATIASETNCEHTQLEMLKAKLDGATDIVALKSETINFALLLLQLLQEKQEKQETQGSQPGLIKKIINVFGNPIVCQEIIAGRGDIFLSYFNEEINPEQICHEYLRQCLSVMQLNKPISDAVHFVLWYVFKPSLIAENKYDDIIPAVNLTLETLKQEQEEQDVIELIESLLGALNTLKSNIVHMNEQPKAVDQHAAYRATVLDSLQELQNDTYITSSRRISRNINWLRQQIQGSNNITQLYVFVNVAKDIILSQTEYLNSPLNNKIDRYKEGLTGMSSSIESAMTTFNWDGTHGCLHYIQCYIQNLNTQNNEDATTQLLIDFLYQPVVTDSTTLTQALKAVEALLLKLNNEIKESHIILQQIETILSKAFKLFRHLLSENDQLTFLQVDFSVVKHLTVHAMQHTYNTKGSGSRRILAHMKSLQEQVLSCHNIIDLSACCDSGSKNILEEKETLNYPLNTAIDAYSNRLKELAEYILNHEILKHRNSLAQTQASTDLPSLSTSNIFLHGFLQGNEISHTTLTTQGQDHNVMSR